MRKKFGGYTINCTKPQSRHIDSDTIESVVELSGNIEIGLEIDRMTWREDWLLKLIYGDNSSNYDIITLEQKPSFVDHVDHNLIRVVCRGRC